MGPAFFIIELNLCQLIMLTNAKERSTGRPKRIRFGSVE